jgi:pyrroloquinoline-quinone synthase
MSVVAPTGLRVRMEDALKGRHSKIHPFTELWVEGKLSREQLGAWACQHYHYVGHFSEWLAALYSRTTHFDVQEFFLENMWEEEMGTRHVDLLIRFAEACGYSRRDVVDAELLPGTAGIQGWCYQLAHGGHFVEAAAGLLVGLESQTPQIYARNTPPLREKYGFAEHEIEFFTVHMVADVEHSERGYQIVERYATTAELQDLAVRTVRLASQMRWLYMSGIHRHHVLNDDSL